jgi:PAN domain
MTIARAAAAALLAGCAASSIAPPRSSGPAPTPTAPESGAGLSWEPNTDRPGSDYKDFDVRLPQDCREACARDARCRAFTDRGGRCWLKQVVPDAVADSCCLSGAKGVGPDMPPPPPPSTTDLSMEPGTDRPGSDFRDFPAARPEICRDACAPEPRCRAFALRDGVCYLKQSAPGRVRDSCCVSGARLGESPNK